MMSYLTIPPTGKTWPLPSSEDIGLDDQGIAAWGLLLSAEAEALALSPPPSAQYHNKLVAVRLVAWFLKDLWEHGRREAYQRFISEINSCHSVSESVTAESLGGAAQIEVRHENVFHLGLGLRNHLFRVFFSRPAPSTLIRDSLSPHASWPRPSYEQYRADILKDIANIKPQEGRTHSQAKADALFRDGYKCAITGLYDTDTLMDFQEFRDKAKAEGVYNIGTEVVHIFPSGARSDDEYAASVTAILNLFGLESMADAFLGNRANNLFNVMTLCGSLQTLFDQFFFWLEAIPGEEHTYNLVPRNPHIFFRSVPTPPRQVKFAVDPQSAIGCEVPLDLPDPELLALRASCARVAAKSGAADQWSLMMQEREDAEENQVVGDGTLWLLDSLLSALPVRSDLSRM
ncbi:hypothetical protein C8R45DRAFT_188240 [Mycena sanguinolenta]|nr:hypothetical protein C8R45DRAFT_188240 [Mycena sanguinolenta]